MVIRLYSEKASIRIANQKKIFVYIAIVVSVPRIEVSCRPSVAIVCGKSDMGHGMEIIRLMIRILETVTFSTFDPSDVFAWC